MNPVPTSNLFIVGNGSKKGDWNILKFLVGWKGRGHKKGKGGVAFLGKTGFFGTTKDSMIYKLNVIGGSRADFCS